jgi:hypothetical protein
MRLCRSTERHTQRNSGNKRHAVHRPQENRTNHNVSRASKQQQQQQKIHTIIRTVITRTDVKGLGGVNFEALPGNLLRRERKKLDEKVGADSVALTALKPSSQKGSASAHACRTRPPAVCSAARNGPSSKITDRVKFVRPTTVEIFAVHEFI